MAKIAIIQFPGTNCEYETRRAVRASGMEGVLVRWNDDYEKIKTFDAYILPGGFSYEDRVRAGAIAARDPLMQVIRREAEKGKPVLGICNGAQMLVEAGLIPGLNHGHIQAALAANNHGWLNIWISIVNDAEAGRTPFNDYPQGQHFRLPIAHGEGRFVIREKTLSQLIANRQTIFRYCDEQGKIKNEFPINPNGSDYSLAGVCNPAGNVLALMSHPERVKEGQLIFESLRKHLENKKNRHSEYSPEPEAIEILKQIQDDIKPYNPPADALELFVNLIITDNEAVTLEQALHQMGFKNVKVMKKTHWEIVTLPPLGSPLTRGETIRQGSPLKKGEIQEGVSLINRIINSGELCNTNKEIPTFRMGNAWYRINGESLSDASPLLNPQDTNILVRYNEDYEGMNKLCSLKGLGFKEITTVKKGVVWHIEAEKTELQKILATNILYNPYSQTAYLVEA